MKARGSGQPIEILLVEDGPGGVRLTREAQREARIANRPHAVGTPRWSS